MHGEDEDEERERQAREREGMPLIDRLLGGKPRTTKKGFLDKRRRRATGRIVPLGLRVHPRVKAMWDRLIERDGHPSGVAFAEVLLETYQQIHGAIPKSELPTDEELIRNFEIEQDKDDAN